MLKSLTHAASKRPMVSLAPNLAPRRKSFKKMVPSQLAPSWREAILTPKLMAPRSPSTGLLMRTDSSQLALICPSLHQCPNTSSNCWLIWGPLASYKRFSSKWFFTKKTTKQYHSSISPTHQQFVTEICTRSTRKKIRPHHSIQPVYNTESIMFCIQHYTFWLFNLICNECQLIQPSVTDYSKISRFLIWNISFWLFTI